MPRQRYLRPAVRIGPLSRAKRGKALQHQKFRARRKLEDTSKVRYQHTTNRPSVKRPKTQQDVFLRTSCMSNQALSNPIEVQLTNMSRIGCDRWEGTLARSSGQHGSETVAQWPEDRCGPLRSHQHIWGVFPLKTCVLSILSNTSGRHIPETFSSSKASDLHLLIILATVKYQAYLRKITRFNPTRGGPFHFRAPSRIFYKTVRGMIPHKTARGAAAMERLKVFEGIPPPYDKKQRQVVPQALRVIRLKPGRKYCTVGRLGHEFGWKYQDVVARYCQYLVTLSTWLILTSLLGLRKGEKSSLPRTTRGRRLQGGIWRRPRRKRVWPRT